MPDPDLSLWRRLIEQHSAASGRPLSADVIDELAMHIADVYTAERERGCSDDEARRLALDVVAHGAYAEVAACPRAAAARDSRLVERVSSQPGRLWSGLSFDVRYAWRSVQRQPAFSVAVVVIIALGIGATTAAFAVLESVLLRPLPYPESRQLVVLKRVTPKEESRALAAADWLDYQSKHAPPLALAAYASWPMNMTGSGEPERLRSVIVSGDFFTVIGALPVLGRVTGAADDTPSADRVVVLSHGLWRRRFGENAAVIGTRILVNGNPATVVGVMARDFAIPNPDVDLWMPMGLAAEVLADRASEWLSIIGRLDRDVDMLGVQAALAVTSATLETAYPRTNADERVRIRPLLDELTVNVRTPLWLGTLAAVFVFLAGCANAANLMIARATMRRDEIAIRAGLGAEPLRIARQLLVESAALAALGGALGIGVAQLFLAAFVVLADGRMPRVDQLSLGSTAILVATAASLATTLLFGGTAAWLLVRRGSAGALRDDSRITPPHRAGGFLLAGQVAFALMLLTGAMVVGRAYSAIMRTDPGFDVTDTLTMQLTLPRNRYPNSDAHAQFAGRVIEEIIATPGVTSAGIVSDLPFVGNALNFRVGAAGAPQDAAEQMTVRPADAGFFRTLRIPLRSGRLFAGADRTGAEPVAIVNQSAVDRLGSAGRVGGRIAISGEPPRTIVGTVGDIRHGGLHDTEGPVIYVPYAQKSFGFLNWMGIVVRGPDAEGLTAAAKAAVLLVDPNQPVQSVLTMAEYVDRAAAPLQFGALIVGSLAGAALVLAVTGIYGLTSFVVGRRSREFGLRLALGASRGGIVRLVLAQIGVTIMVGAIVGLAGAMATNEIVGAALMKTQPGAEGDVIASVASAVLLLITALAAALGPALRATRIDPKTALQAQ